MISKKTHNCTSASYMHLYTHFAYRDEGPVSQSHPSFPAGMKVQKVEGGGHFLHQEQSVEVNDSILKWFERFKT